MTEFITGLILGIMLSFFAFECKKWENYYISNQINKNDKFDKV